MTITIDNQTARRVILHLQGLSDKPNRRLSPDGLIELIARLGFVQVDSIQWVERAHHMILFARNQTYRPKMLKRLLEKDRRLFEGWTHDASIVPSQFYPHWRHRHARNRARLEQKFSSWQGDGFAAHCDPVHALIAKRGPIRSRDLEKTGERPKDMWQWDDGKAALEFLWRTGELAIVGRDGFQKIYDLPENAIPPAHLNARVSHDEFVDWCCRMALDRLGFGSASDIARFWDHISIAEARAWMAEQSSGSVIQALVEGVDGKLNTCHARADIASLIEHMPDLPKRMRVLSPFDPVIRDRTRLMRLWGFDYRIEIYVPEEKRRWGYYVFPLLEGDRIVGRIDMRADRKRNRLVVRRLWLERKVRFGTDRRARLESELRRQAVLANVSRVEWSEGALD